MLYIYDDTYDGVMTAVFDAFARRDRDAEIIPQSRQRGPSLFDTTLVCTDTVKSGRVQDGLSKLSGEVPPRMYTAWLTHAEGVEDLLLAVTRVAFKHKANPFALRHYEAVCKLDAWARKAGGEAHRMLQFVRFVKLGNGTGRAAVYAADIEPEYEILALIGNHFHARFPDCRFVIRDVRHMQAIISEPGGWYMTTLTPENCEPLPDDGEFERMWRMYFKTIAIEQRVNRKLQQQFVPKKYRRFMTEFETHR